MEPLTMCHSCQVWESHSPEGIEVDAGSMFEHGGADALWSSLSVFGVVIQEHHRLMIS
jgi:hypothetical protein